MPGGAVIVAETPRLILRHVAPLDAPFVLTLLTDPDFVAMIGDRGVHDLADAERWAGETMPAIYADKGFGMFVLVDRADGTAIGLAGLVDRQGLDDVDLGFALLPQARGKGFATEAGRAVLDWAAARGIAPIVAIVSLANAQSVFVLDKLGFAADQRIRLPGVDEEVMLYRRPGESAEGNDMLLAMLLLSQGVQTHQEHVPETSAPCAATDAALPPALAGWTAPRPVGDLRPGSALTVRLSDRASAKLDGLPAPKKPGRAAVTRFSVSAAGTYGIALDQKGWIDVFTAKGRQPLVSIAHGHGPDCSTIAKIVRFSLPRGSYRVLLSGIQRPTARVMLVEGA